MTLFKEKTAAYYKKKTVEEDVMQLAIERMNIVYDCYDRVVVSFSGGKDSTTCLNIALKVARERKQLPLDVIFWDEEAIVPETIDYVRRVAQSPDINLRWYCYPVLHRNGCSTEQAWWSPWAPEDRELWCNVMPAEGIHTIEGAPSERLPIPEMNPYVIPKSWGRVAMILGIRAAESWRRKWLVSGKLEDNWIHTAPSGKNIMYCKPIYDWSAFDVWTAADLEGWDYNHAYDVMSKLGMSPSTQRVAPPFGQEPMKMLWMYAQGWPELFEKMLKRVPGVACAARYSRSPLYLSSQGADKPADLTWQEAVMLKLKTWPIEERKHIAQRIRREIAKHNRATNNADVPETGKGLTWQSIYRIVTTGDFKARLSTQYDVSLFHRGDVGPAGNRIVKK